MNVDKKSRQQQKLMLTGAAREELRQRAEALGWEMSEVVEYLIIKGEYPDAN